MRPILIYPLDEGKSHYSYFPDIAISYLVKQASIGAGYTVGRMFIGKKLASAVAMRIAMGIAATSAYKQMARRLGVSAGASASGIGTPIGLLMMQGLLQRSSHASLRLKSKSPNLYKVLRRNGNLQLMYFLLEKPLKKYLGAIVFAEQNLTAFQTAINKKYQLQSDDHR